MTTFARMIHEVALELRAQDLRGREAETAVPLYVHRVRKTFPTPDEREIRRYLLRNVPPTRMRYLDSLVFENMKKGKIKNPNLSVLPAIDWETADALADAQTKVANYYGGRFKGICRRAVREAMQAVGNWSNRIFRYGNNAADFVKALDVASKRRPSAASAAIRRETRLAELRLDRDPLVRGAILVFHKKVCGYRRPAGHIEVLISVQPLQAASYKFHDVDTGCLIQAERAKALSVYVPVKRLEP